MSRTIRVLILAATLAGVFAVAPAGAHAAFKFGSKLATDVQPSNANTAHPCDEDAPGTRCTWVMNEAYGRPNGGHRAPRAGTIRKIRLIAGASGSFRLMIVKVRRTSSGVFQARAIRRGPMISYGGQPDDKEPYRVETFTVNVPVKKGQRLAINAARTSTLRCSSGGANTLLFDPPLRFGRAFRRASDDDGCWLLLEAVVRPAG